MATTSRQRDDISAALKKITYGFYVLTTKKDASEMVTRNEDYLAAGTVSWISQVSFEPPMIMVAVRRDSDLNETIQKSRVFALNFIGSTNQPMIEAFAHKTEVRENRLDGYPYEEGQTGAPLLTAAPVHVECRVREVVQTGGDHVLFVGEVVSANVKDDNARMVSDQEIGYVYGG